MWKRYYHHLSAQNSVTKALPCVNPPLFLFFLPALEIPHGGGSLLRWDIRQSLKAEKLQQASAKEEYVLCRSATCTSAPNLFILAEPKLILLLINPGSIPTNDKDRFNYGFSVFKVLDPRSRDCTMILLVVLNSLPHTWTELITAALMNLATRPGIAGQLFQVGDCSQLGFSGCHGHDNCLLKKQITRDNLFSSFGEDCKLYWMGLSGSVDTIWVFNYIGGKNVSQLMNFQEAQFPKNLRPFSLRSFNGPCQSPQSRPESEPIFPFWVSHWMGLWWYARSGN